MIKFLVRPFNSSGNFQLERTAKSWRDCTAQIAILRMHRFKQIPSHRPDRDQ